VLALFVFSPSLIAHFSVAATDGAATLFIFAAAWGLVRSQQQPTWKRTFWLGMLPTWMILAKFSAPAGAGHEPLGVPSWNLVRETRRRANRMYDPSRF
jgi:hypothetical protein